MIEFNEDHKLIWHKINKQQALVFLNFLTFERGRHTIESARTDQEEKLALQCHNELKAKLWHSAHERHRQDILDIEKLQRQVKEYFGL